MNKNVTDIFFKIFLIVLAAIVGWVLFPLTANLLIKADMFSEAAVNNNAVLDMTEKAVLVWLVCTGLSVASLFIKNNYRYFFLGLPVFAPSLFALIYSLQV